MTVIRWSLYAWPWKKGIIKEPPLKDDVVHQSSRRFEREEALRLVKIANHYFRVAYHWIEEV